tara:strand:- start:2366 stop:2725 length:360 start_codon:yes stop_codon:yes gene_type:complete
MEFNAEDVRTYVPAWDGNREKAAEEQILIKLVPMTGGEYRAAQRAAVGPDGNMSLSSAQAAVDRIIQTRVVEVIRCHDILDRPITTGKGLVDAAEQSLLDEVIGALTKASVLRDGLKKD